jgi:hypothetical protein
MTDPLDLWVRTDEGLVRADQIVHVEDRQSGLEVTLSLITTVGSSQASIVQVTHTVGSLASAEGKRAGDAFVAFIAQFRSQRRTGVIALDEGHLTFSEFPLQPQSSTES